MTLALQFGATLRAAMTLRYMQLALSSFSVCTLEFTLEDFGSS